MKSKEVAVSKSVQKRIAIQSEPQGNKKDRPRKNPRVPIFPPQTVPLVNLLNQMLDNPETDGERRALAYGLLSRLCVMWAPPIVRERFTVTAELVEYHEDRPEDARCRLLGNPPLVDDIVRITMQLFPNGEGLPPQEGCPL